VPSNGEVEGPPRSAYQAPRAHTVFPRPRRVPTGRSRTPSTIVRSHQSLPLALNRATATPSPAHAMKTRRHIKERRIRNAPGPV
jgi:hypothetical protein